MNSISKTDKKHEKEIQLGKNSIYISKYDSSLLYSIPRALKRKELNINDLLPFNGYDIWNAYELSWLNTKGKPIVALAQFDIAANSTYIIESKSFKLYLNSFNNSHFSSLQAVKLTLTKDVQQAIEGKVQVKVFQLDDFKNTRIETFPGQCLDNLDISCQDYSINTDYLSTDKKIIITEELYSNLLKSNCLVTGQPDWGTIYISYHGHKINHADLLKYIISFRNHNEFHEQCVERIFMDITKYCKPKKLTVFARYTRRGGLDINPIRSTELNVRPSNIRLARQ